LEKISASIRHAEEFSRAGDRIGDCDLPVDDGGHGGIVDPDRRCTKVRGCEALISKMLRFFDCVKANTRLWRWVFSFLGTWNPSAGCPPMLANGLPWGKRGRVPTFAPSVLKPPLLQPLPAGKDWLQCASTKGGHPAFWD